MACISTCKMSCVFIIIILLDSPHLDIFIPLKSLKNLLFYSMSAETKLVCMYIKKKHVIWRLHHIFIPLSKSYHMKSFSASFLLPHSLIFMFTKKYDKHFSKQHVYMESIHL